MSQIDKLNFFPHIFWFIVLFGVFYFLIFSYILPLIFQSLEVRSIFFSFLLSESFSFNIFFYFLVHFYNVSFFTVFVQNLLFFLKAFKHIDNLTSYFSSRVFYIV